MTLLTLQRHDPGSVPRAPAASGRRSSLLLGGLAFVAIVGGLVALRAAIWMPNLWH